ncbi:MAG: hypothetical protein AAGI11_23050 [Pseudomonadota bacterium]
MKLRMICIVGLFLGSLAHAETIDLGQCQPQGATTTCQTVEGGSVTLTRADAMAIGQKMQAALQNPGPNSDMSAGILDLGDRSVKVPMNMMYQLQAAMQAQENAQAMQTQRDASNEDWRTRGGRPDFSKMPSLNEVREQRRAEQAAREAARPQKPVYAAGTPVPVINPTTAAEEIDRLLKIDHFGWPENDWYKPGSVTSVAKLGSELGMDHYAADFELENGETDSVDVFFREGRFFCLILASEAPADTCRSVMADERAVQAAGFMAALKVVAERDAAYTCPDGYRKILFPMDGGTPECVRRVRR